jgi:hypothetical protein
MARKPRRIGLVGGGLIGGCLGVLSVLPARAGEVPAFA